MTFLMVGSRSLAQALEKTLAGLRPAFRVASGVSEIASEHRRGVWDIVFVDGDFFKNDPKKIGRVLHAANKFKKPVVVISSERNFACILKIKDLGASDYALKPFNERELIMRVSAILQRKTKIACIGGGTGLFHLLLGLKTMQNVLLTSVVSMSDDGGSSGKLSESLGLLPPGDIRRSLVALSNAPQIMNDILQYRFEKKGELEGHSFGNIFLAALTGVKGTMSEAVRSLSDILYLQGIVLPASRTLTKLVARFEDGSIVKGESRIDRCVGRPAGLRIRQLDHEPRAAADTDAAAAILFSDFITIGPGDLYTSIITNLAIKEIREAIVRAPAGKIYICNLMTKPGETTGLDAADHIGEVVKYLGADCLDYVLISNTKLSKKMILDYRKKNQAPVFYGDARGVRKATAAKIILADIGSTRELARHESVRLKNEIQKIIRFKK